MVRLASAFDASFHGDYANSRIVMFIVMRDRINYKA